MTFKGIGAVVMVLVTLVLAGIVVLGALPGSKPVEYVRIAGTSMLPTFHTGDIVVVRRAPEYVVGDVVAYRFGTSSLVMHRIVDSDGEHFTLRGDNNDFDDSTHPAAAEVAGKLWFRVPAMSAMPHGPGAVAL